MPKKEQSHILAICKNKRILQINNSNIEIYGKTSKYNVSQNVSQPNIINNGTMNINNIDNSKTINTVNTKITNNVQTTNIENINININPLGQEDLTALTKEEKLKILNRVYNAVPELIKTIHNKPNNRNFYLSNRNKNIVGFVNKQNELEYH